MRIRPDRRLRLGSPLAIASVCGVAYLVLVGAGPGSHAQKGSRGPISAQTVVADRAARVYGVPTGNSRVGTIYDYDACAVANGKAQPLARSARIGVCLARPVANECRLVRELHLSRATVGVIVERHGVDTVDSTLTVRDLAGAHVLHTMQTSTIIGYGDSLITYVLAASGSIAWATVTTSPNVHPHATIHRAIGQTVRTLD